MSADVILPYSDKRRLRAVEQDLLDVKRAIRGDPSLQRLPDGSVLMPRGVTIGGGGQDVVYVPAVVPPPTALVFTPGASSDEVWVDVEWSAPTELGADQVTSYEVRYRHDGLRWVTTSTAEPELRLEGLIPAVLYDVEVYSVTRLGKTSAALAGSVLTLADTIAPAQVANLRATSAVETVFLEWDAVPDRDVPRGGHYQSQVATDDAFVAVVADVDVAGSATHVVVPGLTPGQQVWTRVRAVDAAANAGPWSLTATTTPGEATVAPSDGAAPAASPAVTAVRGGPGYLLAEWDEVANADPLVYDVHLGTASTFVPAAATLVGSAGGTAHFIRATGTGDALVYGTTYYVKIVARDEDGSAPAGAAGSGQMVKANTADIAVGAITAASAIIADATIGTALLIDASITNAKIADLAVTTAKIADAVITNAKIANLAVDSAKIADLAVGSAKISDLSASKLTAGTLTADVTVSSLISTGATGARVELRPEGINGYATDGVTKNLEYRTVDGQVTVRGTIEASTITGSTIEGGTLQTSASGARVVIDSAGLRGYATDGVTENLTYDTATGEVTVSGTITGSVVEGSIIRTALSGARVVIDSAEPDRVKFISAENIVGSVRGYRLSATESGVALYASDADTTFVAVGPGQVVLRAGITFATGGMDIDHDLRVKGNPASTQPDFYVDDTQVLVGDQRAVWGRGYWHPGRLNPRATNVDGDYSKRLVFMESDWGWPGIGFYDVPGNHAAIFKMVTGGVLECRRWDDAAFSDIRASAFVVNSARADKRNVTTLASDRRNAARSLRPVTFRRPVPPPTTTPEGAVPDTPEALAGAAYTAARAERALPGLVAEELAEVMPEVLDHDADGQVVGYDLSAVVSMVLAYAQGLDDRLTALEAPRG